MKELLQSGVVPSSNAATLTWYEALALRYRLLTSTIIHSLLFTLSLLMAFLVWNEAGPGGGYVHRQGSGQENAWFGNFLSLLPFFLLVKLIIFRAKNLLTGGWEFSSIRDVSNILTASWLFVLVTFLPIVLFVYLPGWMGYLQFPVVGPFFQGFPKGVLVVDFLVSVFLVCTARLGFRIYREELRPISSEGVRRVLIVGAGNAAEAVIREIHRMKVERYRVIGLIDDDPAKRTIFIHGIPILGTTAELASICQEHDIEEIIIAMPSATQKQLRHVIELCSGTKCKFQSLPSVGDLIDGKVTVSQIHPVDINDLLGRAAVEMDHTAVANFIRGRRVLITGAGGSIGSEMCRQVIAYQPANLILVEQAENPLFDIEGELKRNHPDTPLAACICDIFDRARVLAIWERHRPEVVIHAAAHKHVPLMEHNPCEAVKNNIFGTRNVADASCQYEVAEFVMISTDKAVNPSSVMGAGKRVAEIYTQSLNGRAGCKTQFKAVRFGNVLGSSGSVIPTFRRQIAQGGPVTVTDPSMTRYFMTIPEASQLVLQAAAMGHGGQIYLLDMGEPVKIVDLARQMITLSGFRPDEDIEIRFTGVRPGEKLFEELRTDGEDIEPTVHPKINVWKHRPVEWATVEETMEELAKLANSPDRARIVSAIQGIVPEYTPLNAPTGNSEAKPAPASQAQPAQAGQAGG